MFVGLRSQKTTFVRTKNLLALASILAFSFAGIAQSKNEWYQDLRIRGYLQTRYNGLLQTNPDLKCEQCDRSWGGEGGFFIRRARIIFFGNIHPRVYMYIQPDFASSASGDDGHYGQLRDAYFDVALNTSASWRVRIGQSKVPFGFENMQSSQNRLALDRNDALNSAVRNERDLGVMLYWAPPKVRDLYRDLVGKGLKGSGDYGVFGLGAYNGQTANRPEANSNRHIVARATYPFVLGSQILEPGIQAYRGQYTILPSALSSGVKYATDRTYVDQRIAGTAVLYPKPWGLTAEYNIGQGPEFNPATDSIEVRPLHGGYVLGSYMGQVGSHTVIPFARAQYYHGAKKHERDARAHRVRELELGVEWQPNAKFELVVMYTFSNRTTMDFRNPMNAQAGSLLRIQAQMNF